MDTDEKTGFEITAAAIEPHITSRTKLVIINSPCNPSGAVIPRQEFLKIFELTSKRGVFLMTDERAASFYTTMLHSPSLLYPDQGDCAGSGSLSKTYAMTGWRIGFALAPTPIIGAMTKLQSHSTSNPTSIAQKAAVEAMLGPQDSVPVMLAEYHRRRDFVIKQLEYAGVFSITTPKGAFYAYPNISVAYNRGA